MLTNSPPSFRSDIPRILAKTPFARLLISLVPGILAQYYLHISGFAVVLLCIGLLLLTLSYILHPRYQYQFRWIFGSGIFLSFFALAVISTSYRQNESAFTFLDTPQKYIGTITEISREKSKTLTCEVHLKDTDKKIVCYIQKGVRSAWLNNGDEIELEAKISRIKHLGNPFDFDYPAYMYHKGFSGSVYLFSDDWEATGNRTSSPAIAALECRKAILKFYRSLDLTETEFALLSALTLGDKNELSDELKNTFRITGTAHILAVSGMHVGIICSAIVAIFGLFCFRVRFNRVSQILIILLLWTYAFVTGLPPSVVRASTVLTIFCFANIFNRKGLAYNNIAIAACGMLLYNPFYLFDVGFQLSFTAVLAICTIHPLLRKIIPLKNKYLRKGWDLFTLSFAAQVGTLPICLYYFGMFPTYFFITNMVIVPLVSLLVYVAFMLLVCKLFAFVLPASISAALYYLPVYILKIIVSIMTTSASFFANLPFASINHLNISLSTVFALLVLIILGVLYTHYRKIKILHTAFSVLVLWMIACAIPPQNSFSIYQDEGQSKIAWNIGHAQFDKEMVSGYNFVRINGKTFLSLNSDYWASKYTHQPLFVDYLHIVNGDSLSLNSLSRNFSVKRVILDVSLSSKNKRKLKKECEKLSIPYYDASEKGFFRINF